MNLDAAAIDLGASEHYVAVPPGRSAETVRSFGGYTAALHEMARRLKECAITTVALESTGSYWIAPYQILEASGFKVVLVKSRRVAQKPARAQDRMLKYGQAYRRRRRALLRRKIPAPPPAPSPKTSRRFWLPSHSSRA